MERGNAGRIPKMMEEGMYAAVACQRAEGRVTAVDNLRESLVRLGM